MLRSLVLSLSLSLAGLPALAETFQDAAPGLVSMLPDDIAPRFGQMNMQHGKVTLPGGLVTLNLPDQFYFLSREDADWVLEKLWGNPPGDPVLGMVLAKGSSPVDPSAYAAIFTYDEMGHVSDEDAAATDFNALLTTLKQDAIDGNPERQKAGYAPYTVIGWAAEPHYDAVGRKLYWAEDIKFEGEAKDTLNYRIRALGRKGVLEVNFVAPIDALPKVEADTPAMLAMIDFTDGNRYADFVPGLDTVAAVGIGGLIAGNVAAKTGLLVLALAFLKKGFLLLLIPVYWVKNKFFGNKPQA